MSSPHDAFKALGPVTWAVDFDLDNEEAARKYVTDILADSQSLVGSIPGLETEGAEESRIFTDTAKALRKDWKEVKVGSKENPLGVAVYKLSGKDGKGAWFARRSVHEGLSFEKWKLAMEKEFAETMKDGKGNIRGIGAEKRVEHRVIEDCANIQVYHLSAQFPAVTPRDFITMMITSDKAPTQPPDTDWNPRQFTMVSKPCNHPECPQRQGFVRGFYESVEFIREIRTEKPLRRVRSSIDIPKSNEAKTDLSASQPLDSKIRQEQEYDTKIEWLMVTRSDPGGSIPRFMVEKGTPGGIAGDAEKFLRWASAATPEDFEEVHPIDSQFKEDAKRAHETAELEGQSMPAATTNLSHDVDGTAHEISPGNEEQRPVGFYGMISGAMGAAASYLQPSQPAGEGNTEDDSDLSESDTSSSLSFHSIEDDDEDTGHQQLSENEASHLSRSNTAGQHSISGGSTTGASGKVPGLTRHEKELRKLEDRKLKHEKKMQQEEQAALTRRAEDSKRDESGLAKLREKHAKERSRREDKYQREVQRLEEKRKQDERKKEAKVKKAREREERKDVTRELEKTRIERDTALKQVEVLKEQLGELQRENTTLVMKLGAQEGEEGDEMVKELTGATNTLDLAGKNNDKKKKEHKKKGSEAKSLDRAGGIQRSQTTDVIPK